jgi:hypothetical protein
MRQPTPCQCSNHYSERQHERQQGERRNRWRRRGRMRCLLCRANSRVSRCSGARHRRWICCVRHSRSDYWRNRDVCCPSPPQTKGHIVRGPVNSSGRRYADHEVSLMRRRLLSLLTQAPAALVPGFRRARHGRPNPTAGRWRRLVRRSSHASRRAGRIVRA